ncbi:hypothetical protein P0082_11330 [Candidatus Haliotispira prima]|uniref:Uncharacterized protein n=1 Tax=Candidatus Haliotispira prima TaxID=3034016 RepID=A0ABY8MIM8_9SPIO|nr:hypothetical protein P0082_11330 [Candidatus Haliotispira prima]
MGNDPKIKEAEEDFEKNSEKYAGEYDENLFLKAVLLRALDPPEAPKESE